jgi:hypothetical protein
MSHPTRYIAFHGVHRLVAGELSAVVAEAWRMQRQPDGEPLLVFDDRSGRVVDIDYRGELADVLARLPLEVPPATAKRGPGRPKLGVVAREVTLLPRHWEWLASQSGGASVALRRLVEAASRESTPKDRARQSREAADRFILTMAGNLAGYEEAMRAFYRHDDKVFASLSEAWPHDIRDHARALVAIAREDEAALPSS